MPKGLKVYVWTTWGVFLLVLLGHVARIVQGGTAVLADPVFAVSTLIVVALCAWGLRLVRQLRDGP